MKLAEGGLPKGGGVGYEIFDKSDALGATSFVQNINHLRALEGELARTIRAHRPRAGGARASGAARAAAVLARQGRGLGLDRAQGARRARAAAGARDPPPGRVGGQRPQAASASRSSTKPAACSPTAPRRRRSRRRRRRRAPGRATSGACATRSKRSSPRWSARAARACSSPPISTSTASPRPRTNSIRKAACCAPARRARKSSASGDGQRRPGHGRQRVARRAPAAAGEAARHAARPEQASPRKSSTTRFRAPPRPR